MIKFANKTYWLCNLATAKTLLTASLTKPLEKYRQINQVIALS
ncbi:hypothetical protein [uncultured Clostridium sp.]|nr:hypothetical protein [uncultured Clostridium sp.]